MNAPTSFNFGKFRKLPVVIEAAQYPGFPDVMKPGAADAIERLTAFEDWLMAKAIKAGKGPCRYRGMQLVIPTLEGEVAANPGDWVAVGVASELYPIEREIFAQTYVRVQE